eukprot:CAMPEP_0197020878 /NCGR_PEP_ID=MMETSP1384-20130603/1735_1 /TAXON_ID=29189 /ORGANISM="Ammonia sp." /LENGTH=258 /DNA_ID=CAMNT_0042448591 /DNA_START=61 /DNA_END=837 /DNA_ORIENTATION=-
MAEQKEEKPSFRLSYFGLPGRANSIRVALAVAGFAFEDVFVSFEEHGKAKAEGKRRWGGLPELTIFDKDGKEVQTIGQSAAQLRYIGRLAGLYGANAMEAALIDEFMDALGDTAGALKTDGVTDKEKQKALRLAAIAEDGALTAWLKKLAVRMEENEKKGNKNGFVVGDTMSIADLFFYGGLSQFISGYFDGIPKDLYSKMHPRLDNFLKMMNNVDKIKAFNEKFGQRLKDCQDDAKKKDAKVVVYPGKQADIYGAAK